MNNIRIPTLFSAVAFSFLLTGSSPAAQIQGVTIYAVSSQHACSAASTPERYPVIGAVLPFAMQSLNRMNDETNPTGDSSVRHDICKSME
jgi:hypothetical protein